MMSVGDIMSTPWDFQYIGDTMSTLEDVQYIGGYHEYTGDLP